MSRGALTGAMARAFGGQSMVAPLRRVLVRRPDASFAVDDPVAWHYSGRPNLSAAQREHDAFAAILRDVGAEVLYHDAPQPGRADAIYVFDPVLLTDAGMVVLRMGKRLREGEEDSLASRLEDLDIPVLGRLEGSAQAEGGDLLWLDPETLAVGQGFRTNEEGHEELRRILRDIQVRTVPVPLPCHRGPDACLHLLSLISPLAEDLAVAYPPLIPVPFWVELRDRGYEIAEVPAEEFETMAPNVLALGPREGLMLDGNPITRKRLEEAGCRVRTYRGEEISRKAEGGPTCLTRPILRRP